MELSFENDFFDLDRLYLDASEEWVRVFCGGDRCWKGGKNRATILNKSAIARKLKHDGTSGSYGGANYFPNSTTPGGRATGSAFR